MELWNDAVALLARGLVDLSVAFGGNLGLAIVGGSLLVRLSLMPWTLRIARAAQRQRERLKLLEPELEALRKRHAGDSRTLSEETLALYSRHGIKLFDPRMWASTLVQLPLMAALSSAIQRGLEVGGRFLWIKDLARPDALIAFAVAALAGVAAALAPGAAKDARWVAILLPAVLSLVFAWKISAGLGLYWAVSSGVGVAQAALLRRRR